MATLPPDIDSVNHHHPMYQPASLDVSTIIA